MPNARILDLTPEQYHADSMGPALSYSIAKILLAQSPAHAWMMHPHFGGQKRDPSKAMDRGTLIHKLLLGKGADVVVVEARDYRTNKAKEARDSAYEAGKLPMLAHEYTELSAAADILRNKFADAGYVFDGQSEVAVSWHDRLFLSDRTVLCKAMFDHLKRRGVVWDLKTISSADDDTISKTIYNFGYDIQHAAYSSALRELFPECAGHEDFVFLFCEVEPPYAIAPRRLDGQFREIGERRWARAKKMWRECLDSGKWPAYEGGASRVSPPGWALAKEMELGFATEE